MPRYEVEVLTEERVMYSRVFEVEAVNEDMAHDIAIEEYWEYDGDSYDCDTLDSEVYSCNLISGREPTANIVGGVLIKGEE